MSRIRDSKQLRTEVEYCAALDELEELMLADPDTPAGRRFDELVSLIEEFELHEAHWGVADRVVAALESRVPSPHRSSRYSGFQPRT